MALINLGNVSLNRIPRTNFLTEYTSGALVLVDLSVLHQGREALLLENG